jgi:hypothetical protein
MLGYSRLIVLLRAGQMERLAIILILSAALLLQGCEAGSEKAQINQMRQANEICEIKESTNVIEQLSYSTIPIESRFIIDGVYGCVIITPYRLIICQKGTEVNYFYDHGGKSGEYVLDYEKFKEFWRVCSLVDLNQLKRPFCTMETTADFRGKLTIQCKTEKGDFFREVEFTRGKLEDKDFERLIVAMMEMVSENHRLPDWRGID